MTINSTVSLLWIVTVFFESDATTKFRPSILFSTNDITAYCEWWKFRRTVLQLYAGAG